SAGTGPGVVLQPVAVRELDDRLRRRIPDPADLRPRVRAVLLRLIPSHLRQQLRRGPDQVLHVPERLPGRLHLVGRVDDDLLAPQEQARQLTGLDDHVLAVLARHHHRDLKRAPAAVLTLPQGVLQDVPLPLVQITAREPHDLDRVLSRRPLRQRWPRLDTRPLSTDPATRHRIRPDPPLGNRGLRHLRGPPSAQFWDAARLRASRSARRAAMSSIPPPPDPAAGVGAAPDFGAGFAAGAASSPRVFNSAFNAAACCLPSDRTLSKRTSTDTSRSSSSENRSLSRNRIRSSTPLPAIIRSSSSSRSAIRAASSASAAVASD